MKSSTYKPTVPRWAQRQQYPLSTFSCHILKQNVWVETIFKPDIVTFFEEANLHHPSIKFTTPIHWDNFLNTVAYNGTRFNQKVICDVMTTETFLHTHSTPRPSYPLICQRSLRKMFQISNEHKMDRGCYNLKELLFAARKENHGKEHAS